MDGGSAAYTRFAEEMDIDSDTLDLKVRDRYGYGNSGDVKRWCLLHRKTIGIVALALCLFFLGFVMGHFLHFEVVEHDMSQHGKLGASTPTPTREPEPSPPSNYSNIIHELINKNTLDAYLKKYTQIPHYAGGPNSDQIVDDIKSSWSALGFHVYTKSYTVQISRPNVTNPTRLDTYGDPGVCCNTTYYPNDDPENILLPGFNPYAHSAEIVGQLVYINYGLKRDFRVLNQTARINVRGRICLVRQGKITIRNMVRNCRGNGGIALIVFPDTLHYAPNITKDTNPDTWWLPVNATIREPVRSAWGDPLTPFLPSLEYGSFNESVAADTQEATFEEEVNGPMDFPVQVIGYEQARKYLNTMAHPQAPDDWQGIKMGNHTFSVGPGFASHAKKFKLTINNDLIMTTITNVFGSIPGEEEPDRYVIVGNHRDSLTYGAVEPGTGTACLMELARVLGALYDKGWRPRRTVILASWDAGDDGNIGSAEWVEENVEVLRERAVAYINLDGAVQGNRSFSAAGSPLLSQIMFYATKRVNCPEHTHSDTVYERWSRQRPNQMGAEIEPLGFGSDATPFLHIAGVPVVDVKFTYDKDFYGGIPTYPVKHTAFDTYDYVKRFIDPDMSIHAAVTEIVAEALLSLAGDPLLMIQVVNYADSMIEYLRAIKSRNITSTPRDGLDNLSDVLQRFAAAAQHFQAEHYIPPDMNDINGLRELNDRVMSVERALTGDAGRFYLPQLRHVVYGPDRTGYEGIGFGPINRALYIGSRRNDWSLMQGALTATIARLEAAVHLLTGNPLENDSSLT